MSLKTLLHDAWRGLPPPLLYRATAWRMRLVGETEVRLLPGLVPHDKLALDVGGNYGAYVYWLSRLTPSLIVFEPLPHVAAFLQRVAPPHVRVEPFGLSDRNGETECVVPLRNGHAIEGEASIASRFDPRGIRYRIQTRRLDDMTLDPVGFIKIDVEGHELPVLKGARGLLQRDKPLMLIEIEQRHLAFPMEGVFEWLREEDYEGHFWRNNRWMPLSAFSKKRDQDTRNCTRLGVLRRHYINNFLFVPRGHPLAAPA
ncbi:MAG: FkbM family methyltransferase [Alphaproteobacteria bacterium]